MWVRQVCAEDKTCDYTYGGSGRLLTWYKVTFMFNINRKCGNVSWLTKKAGLNMTFNESE
jgi:hypothetical protein